MTSWGDQPTWAKISFVMPSHHNKVAYKAKTSSYKLPMLIFLAKRISLIQTNKKQRKDDNDL